MNNKHNIKDLDLLYTDAKRIINEIVLQKIDADILKSISDSISKLEECWHGQDAIIHINKLIDVKNLLIDNRDIIGNIGVYISTLAKSYRDAQNSNEIILPSFSQLEYKKIAKSQKINDNSAEIYMNNDISNITTILNSSIFSLNEMNNSVAKTRDSILDNWTQEEENRDYAVKMFENFFENSKIIIKNINEIIKCINTAIDNYNISFSNASNIPNLESMFDNNHDKVEKEYTIEEKKVLSSIEKSFSNNKKITDNFNNILVNSIKKDLISKGIIK